MVAVVDPLPPAAAVAPAVLPPAPPSPSVVTLTWRLLVALAVSSKVMLEIPAPARPAAPVPLEPPLPAVACWDRFSVPPLVAPLTLLVTEAVPPLPPGA